MRAQRDTIDGDRKCPEKYRDASQTFGEIVIPLPRRTRKSDVLRTAGRRYSGIADHLNRVL